MLTNNILLESMEGAGRGFRILAEQTERIINHINNLNKMELNDFLRKYEGKTIKNIEATESGCRIEFEQKEWTPKLGEVVKTPENGLLFLYSGRLGENNTCFGGVYVNPRTGKIETCSFDGKMCKKSVQTSREERTVFFDALTKAGYKWNAKKQELTKAEKWEPKDGDFIMTDDGTISILGAKRDDGDFNVLCRIFKSGALNTGAFGTYTQGFILRPVTDSERQTLLDALAKDGKRWNAEKKCIEPIPLWRAEKRNFYYSIEKDGTIYSTIDVYNPIDTTRYKIGNYFRTKEEATTFFNEHIKPAYQARHNK